MTANPSTLTGDSGSWVPIAGVAASTVVINPDDALGTFGTAAQRSGGFAVGVFLDVAIVSLYKVSLAYSNLILLAS